MANLKDRLAMEAEILDRIDRERASGGSDNLSEEVERIILERELSRLERETMGEEVLVRRRRRET
jgi:hypothetical protein